MFSGVLAGITWALETVFIGWVLIMTPFVSTQQALFFAPFVSTFLHDLFSAVFLFIYNIVKRNFKNVIDTIKTSDFKWIVISSIIGAPIGMTGYVLTVNNLGASIGAVASAIYPAVGTVLACIFLKEKVKWYQWIFLVLTLCGVYGLSYSPTVNVENFMVGLIGVFMCAFGWGIEAVILAKTLKNAKINKESVLTIRQTVSALSYAIIILPVIGGWNFTLNLVTANTGILFPILALAALSATVSYLFYYKALHKVGAAKAMSLNITYTAWAILFSVIILKDFSIINPLTLVCACVVVICGVLAATDFKELIKKKNKLN